MNITSQGHGIVSDLQKRPRIGAIIIFTLFYPWSKTSHSPKSTPLRQNCPFQIVSSFSKEPILGSWHMVGCQNCVLNDDE